jgi:DNA mismatch endonuclease (patch repair protein)
MQANVGRTTKAEQLLRGIVRPLYRRAAWSARPDPTLRCTADAVLRSLKIAIFVDGCFWHGCPLHFKAPKINTPWWREKIADNRARDLRQTRALRARGWSVVRLWEHELRSETGRSAATKMIVKRISARRRS